jgi:hypothetical protein
MKRNKLFLALLFLFVPTLLAWVCPARGQEHPVRILGVAEAAPDLTLALSGEAPGPDMIQVLVRDFFDGVAGEVVLPAPGPGEVPLVEIPGVLEGVVSQGTQYRVEVLDMAGEPVADPYPFRLSLRCSPDGACNYHLLGGLDAGPSVMLDSALAQALDEVAGADDPLGAVLALYPHLLGEVTTLGWELDLLDQAHPGDQDCVCRYTTQLIEDNDVCGGHCGASHAFVVNVAPDIDPGGYCTARVLGGNGKPIGLPGNGGNGGAQPLRYFQVTGSTELRTGVGCWQVVPGGENVVEVETRFGKETLTFTRPILGNCGVECGIDLQYSASQVVELQAEAGSGVAQATEAVSFEVGGTPVYQFGVIAQSLGGGVLDTENRTFTGQSSAQPGDAARLESTGTVDLTGAYGYATGKASSWFILWAHGQSLCTGPPTITVSAKASTDGIGSGADVNILVGQCDG